MAKKPTVTTLQSGFNSTEVLNENFDNIRDAFDNTLSLDGSTPNAMQADLDLNGNNLIGATGLLINGTDYLADVEAAKSAALVAQAAAELAENNAETAEVNAEASETAAGLSATAAATSATAAQTAQTVAELAETNAETAETGAAASAVTAASEAATATTKASEASSSAAAAAASEAGVDADRVAAQAAASAAASSETNAATSATNAAASETNAANSATSASNSASSASSSAASAGSSETAASTSATAAAASALSAAGESAEATTQASNAATSATAAATSETNAATSEANALSYVADSESARDQSQSARDTASLHKLAAEAAATSATNTAAGLAGFDLEAIAASKGVTAVDVFVYDTSKDSDGGAWRKRTQGTSWYNEALNTATRGSRREFPAVAVIVAESNKVTIYDGDDPALPMWMVVDGGSDRFFNTAGGGAITSIAIKNGWLVGTTTTRGYSRFNFISEEAYIGLGMATYKISAPIAVFRNATVFPAYTITGSVFSIVNPTVNDVAMTVLPDAPIDPATGLPVPTIAVATNGGVSVIKDDGTVVDLVNYVTAPPAVSFVDVGGVTKLHTTSRYSNWINVFDIPDADFNTGRSIFGVNYPTNGFASKFSETATSLVSGWSKSLVQFQKDEALTNINGASTANRGVQVVNYITSTYNTGWMNGNIKGAFLSSTDTASLVGSGELVTNGTFDTDLTGWTDTSVSGGSVAYSAGTAVLTSVTVGIGGRIEQNITTVIGRRYRLTVDRLSGSSIIQAPGYQSDNGTGTIVREFTATSTSSTIVALRFNAGTASIDNISVQLADADRSVNNKGLIVNGTVTRSPVATGAELVAYSGFSASNYLEQPYNPDLDFGTGDFCVMGWVKPSTSGDEYVFDCRDSSAIVGFACYRSGSTGKFTLITQAGGNGSAVAGTSSNLTSVWTHLTVSRRSGVLEIYVNGVLEASSSLTLRNVDSTSRYLVIGNSYGYFGYHAWEGSLALLRISATAPTADQIKKIYEDEKVLFQENAACTLYGTSDAVTALAHDSDTGLLHVGTSAGRSVFQGLRRVSNTTTAVGTAISASGGMVVEE